MKKTRKILILLLICILPILKPCAKNNEKDLFQYDDKVKVEKELDGTAFISGNNVEINKTIKGIGFVAGNELKINENQEYLFGAATETTIKGDIDKDLFLLSSIANINSRIKRDAYIAGDEINIKGTIERNVYIYGTEVNLNGTFNGNVTVNATVINVDKDAKISGTLKYNKNAITEGLNDSIKTKTYDITKNISFKDYITSFISSYIHITLVAIVLVFSMEKVLKKSLNQTKDIKTKTIAVLCGKGFLVLIGVPIIAVMLIFSGAFISVGVIGAVLYGIILYIAEIFTAYFIANVLNKKVFKKEQSGYVLVIIGLFIIKVLSTIPILGSLIAFISILLGIGIVSNMIIQSKK